MLKVDLSMFFTKRVRTKTSIVIEHNSIAKIKSKQFYKVIFLKQMYRKYKLGGSYYFLIRYGDGSF
jgi:hypothetical protein